MRGVVYECPPGVFTRIMEGSQGYELYQLRNKSSKAKKELDDHMKQLHNTYFKQTKPTGTKEV